MSAGGSSPRARRRSARRCAPRRPTCVARSSPRPTPTTGTPTCATPPRAAGRRLACWSTTQALAALADTVSPAGRGRRLRLRRRLARPTRSTEAPEPGGHLRQRARPGQRRHRDPLRRRRGAGAVVLAGDVGRPLQRQGGALQRRVALPPAGRVRGRRWPRPSRACARQRVCTSSRPTAPATSTSTSCSTTATSRADGLAVRQRGVGAARPTSPRWPTRWCGVPIYGRAESLNLATAAAVCLYASARAQRR